MLHLISFKQGLKQKQQKIRVDQSFMRVFSTLITWSNKDENSSQDYKQLFNSVLVGYEELLRQRFVLSAEAEG